MDKKYGEYWLGVGVIVMAFLSCSFAAAADKVVVIPLGGGSGAQNESVKVYDGDGQYLGLFVGNNGYYLEILVPTVGKILSIRREGGQVMSYSDYWYYIDNSCTGGPYLKMDYSSNGEELGILFSNDEPNCDFFSSSPFSSLSGPMLSKKNQNGSGICEPALEPGLFSPISTYTNSEVGFLAPVKFPLQFVTE